MKKLSTILIPLFWIFLFFGVLYLPKWKFLRPQEKAISVFTWGDLLDPEVIEEFERATGIKVHLNFYYSNEELAVKLKATEGVGYDLVLPSDYAVQGLVNEGLLKRLDKSKLPFLNTLNPHLLGLFFDPENAYSIPFEWEVFGFGVDTTRLHIEHPSWDLIFNPKEKYTLAMINDPIEAINFAAFYLFGPTSTLSDEKRMRIESLLKRQKKWVEAYTENRGDYFLATRSCPLAVLTSQSAARSMRLFPFVDFVIPEEGTFISIENLCIPKASTKDALVYEFINFLYTKESMLRHYQKFHFFPAIDTPLLPLAPERRFEALQKAGNIPADKTHFFKRLLPPRQTQELWIDVKS